MTMTGVPGHPQHGPIFADRDGNSNLFFFGDETFLPFSPILQFFIKFSRFSTDRPTDPPIDRSTATMV